MAMCGECELRVAIGVQCAACDTWFHCSVSQPCVPLTDPPFLCHFCADRVASLPPAEAAKLKPLSSDLSELRRLVQSGNGSDGDGLSPRSCRSRRSSMSGRPTGSGGPPVPVRMRISSVEDALITEAAACETNAVRRAEPNEPVFETFWQQSLAEAGPAVATAHREMYFRGLQENQDPPRRLGGGQARGRALLPADAARVPLRLSAVEETAGS